MKFNMKRPCSDCPFRRDIDGYLAASRADDIAETMLHENNTFSCHKTLDWYGGGHTSDDIAVSDSDEHGDATAADNEEDKEDWDDEESSRRSAANTEHCAGALIFSFKHEEDIHCANWRLQIAERLGLYDPTKLDQEAFPLVFDTKEEMVDHHASSWSKRRHRHEEATSTASE